MCTHTRKCVFLVFEEYAPAMLLSRMEIRRSTTEKQVIEEMGEEVGDARQETEDGNEGCEAMRGIRPREQRWSKQWLLVAVCGNK